MAARHFDGKEGVKLRIGLLTLLIVATPIAAQEKFDDATLLSVRAVADDLWGKCVTEKAAALAKSSEEPADVIATASLASCANWQNAVLQATEKLTGNGSYLYLAKEAVEHRREYWREQAMLAVIETRSN